MKHLLHHVLKMTVLLMFRGHCDKATCYTCDIIFDLTNTLCLNCNLCLLQFIVNLIFAKCCLLFALIHSFSRKTILISDIDFMCMTSVQLSNQ